MMIPFVALLLLAGACSKVQNSDLVGVYHVGGFGMHDNAVRDSIVRLAQTFSEKPVEFKANDTVIMAPDFGMEFFGDSVFAYTLSGENILFTNDAHKLKLKYEYEGQMLLRLYIEHPVLTRIDLVVKHD